MKTATTTKYWQNKCEKALKIKMHMKDKRNKTKINLFYFNIKIQKKKKPTTERLQ